MKYTIEDLRNGKCAVINDGTFEELREVLKLAFPYDVDLKGYEEMRYFLLSNHLGEWTSTGNFPDKPIQSVKDFLPSIEDKIKELKELAKSQGMDCDVVLSEKKRIEVEPTPSGMLKAIESISEDDHKKFIPYLAKQIEKYLNKETE